MALYMDLEHPDGTIGLPPDSSGSPVGWSAWHWMRLMDAMEEEQDATGLIVPDRYEFMAKHQFIAPETDIWISGGEPGEDYIFTIHSGTIWKCWRNR